MLNYYQVLGLDAGASINQIKTAYRKKAKEFHPDINKEAGAHEQFILVNEAYEYLIKFHSNAHSKVSDFISAAEKVARFRKAWEQQEREKARARAQEYARMRYEAYKNSDIYKATEAADILLNIFGVCMLFLVVVGLPYLIYRTYGTEAVGVIAFFVIPFVLIALFLSIKLFSESAIIDLLKFKGTFTNKVTLLILTGFANTFLFFEYALNTFVNYGWLLFSYLVIILFVFFFTQSTKNRFKKWFTRIAIIPFSLNLIFIINASYSYSTSQEVYWYTYRHSGGQEVLSLIELENDTYQNEQGVRMLMTLQPLNENSCIIYTIGDGLLGMRYVKDVKIQFTKPLNTQ